MGANGSGKSTLLRCLNGLIVPLSGTVDVDGYRTDLADDVFDVRRRVGMVFQNPDDQIVSTTVERELAFGLENIGMDQEDMVERVENALARFSLTDRRESPPHLLSGGDRQRLALAAVWVMQPEYLILDEPTSLLDPRGRSEVFDLLEEAFVRKGIGVLFVTQFPEETLRFDRLIVMEDGAIVEDGHPDAVLNRCDREKRRGVGIPAEIALRDFF